MSQEGIQQNGASLKSQGRRLGANKDSADLYRSKGKMDAKL